MSYGLAYGLSAFGLSKQLKITPDEARGQMDAYFTRFGGVRDYLRSVVEDARQTGYTETIMGRRRYLANLNSDNRNLREMAERTALNAPIQGSAADIIKVAMLGVHRGLAEAGLRSRLLLQVHDELVLEIAPRRARAGRGARPRRDGRRLPARRAARRVGRRRPHLARRRALSHLFGSFPLRPRGGVAFPRWCSLGVGLTDDQRGKADRFPRGCSLCVGLGDYQRGKAVAQAGRYSIHSRSICRPASR